MHIFISYRRAETAAISGRVYSYLKQHLGHKNIFKDSFNIPAGADFRGVLQEAIATCDVALIIIGKQWLTISDSAGNRRLNSPNDFVRIEVETALARDKCRVIPILVDDADIPQPDELPVTMRNLAFIQAVKVRDDPDFDRDMDYLIQQISKPKQVPYIRLIISIISLIIVILLVSGFLLKNYLDSSSIVPIITISSTSDGVEVSQVFHDTTLTQSAETSRAPSTPASTATPSTPSSTPAPSEVPTDLPQTATALASLRIAHNADWKPQSRTFDGVEMVLVPAGCFKMGSNIGEPDEQPVTQWCFDKPFWIDHYEVTNELFQRMGGAAFNAGNLLDAKHPRDNISWFEARDFCNSRGGRLPTEAEWEYASAGPDSLAYAWGSAFFADKAVYGANSASTAEVGSKPDNASWVGAVDMNGNVWEWTSTIYRNYPYSTTDGRESNSDGDVRVARGGAYTQTNPVVLRNANRFAVDPHKIYIDFGFRCARDI